LASGVFFFSIRPILLLIKFSPGGTHAKE
jgi:hypothetical protein